MNVNWNSIRAIDGSQPNGFEELIVQLARLEIPSGTRFERVGSPDAGVECYCILSDGSEWGWQAKFFTSSLTSTQWSQIDRSVQTALDKHPKLTRYYVCVPWDRSDARQRGQKSAMQRWDDHVAKWGGWASQRGMNVKFVWWGASELIDRLSRPEHGGRRLFWFDEQHFTQEWYDDRLNEAIRSAGPRYTPEIHVDLPIACDLELFGRSNSAIDRIKAKARLIRREFGSVSLSREEDKKLGGKIDLKQIFNLRDAILRSFSSLTPEPIGELPFMEITEKLEAALTESVKIEGTLKELEREYDGQQPVSDPRSPSRRNQYGDMLYRFRRLSDTLRQTLRDLKHAEKIANSNVIIIEGDAGTGKTHLLCDISRNRVAENAPTVLLMGQRFTNSTEPWIQALQQVDLSSNLSAEQFLGALEASAQVANQRALLIIDAINEGRGAEIWQLHISAFLARIEHFSQIGVILSVRSSYKERIIPKAIREQDVTITHTGFGQKAYNAVQTFSAYYGINFPSTPILTPDFQNPLFLKIIFEGLKDADGRVLPRGFSGITKTFDFYLNAVNERLAESLDYDPTDNLIQRALERICERMLDNGQHIRWLPIQETKEFVNELLPGREYSRSLYRSLVVEGVLAEDMAWSVEDSYEAARFSYDRFSDYIIADSLLRKYLDPHNPQAAFSEGGELAFVLDQSVYVPSGVIEAMCVQIPERTGKELVRLAPSLMDTRWNIGHAFTRSVVWRDLTAFSADTGKVLNELFKKGAVQTDDVLDTMLTVSTIPGHRFNAESLDQSLRSYAMPNRDTWWSIYLHHAWQNDDGPVHRLIDWASELSSTDDVEGDVVQLAATALAWMLSTPNRFLRDKATKALVALLTDRVDAVVDLLDRFNEVDDLYIRERIYGVAYGVAMRSRDSEKIRELGQAVFDNIFASGKPPAHILLRDYAHGIVERALYLNEILAIDKELLRPPYGSDWPSIPSDAEIERLTPYWGTNAGKWRTLEWSRNRIRLSVMSDDFGLYIVGTNFSTGSSRWSSLLLDEDTWQSPDMRIQVLLENMVSSEVLAWEEYQQTKSDIWAHRLRVQHEEDIWAKIFEPNKEHKSEIKLARIKMLTAMSDITRSELESINLEGSRDFPGFDLGIVQRYVVWRVFDLGWTVDRFGHFDSISIGYSGRHANKAERMGKKYQWIAYHEMLAYLADNYQYRPDFGDTTQIFQGAWQGWHRDIDPSCLLASKPGDKSLRDHKRSWWMQTTYEAWDEDVCHQSWLDAENDIPEIEGLLHTVDATDSTEWFSLDNSVLWRQPYPADVEPYDEPRREVWIECQAYFIRADDVDQFSTWSKGVDFYGRWMPQAYSVNPAHLFLGEHTWSPASEYHSISAGSGYQQEGWSDPKGKCPVSLLTASFRYNVEDGGLDCSIDDNYSLHIPNISFIKAAGLKWTGIGADFTDSQDRLAAFDPSVHEEGTDGLLIRGDVLKNFLAENNLALCWTVVGEKTIVDRDYSQRLKFRKMTGAYITLTGNGIDKIYQKTSYW